MGRSIPEPGWSVKRIPPRESHSAVETASAKYTKSPSGDSKRYFMESAEADFVHFVGVNSFADVEPWRLKPLLRNTRNPPPGIPNDILWSPRRRTLCTS